MSRRTVPGAVRRVLLLAGLLAIGVGLDACGERGARPIDVRNRLYRFLEDGPGAGLWQLHTLDGTSEWMVADHPRDATCLLVARVEEDGAPGKTRIWEKHRLARFFLPGDLDLFFLNYRPLAQDVVEDGPETRLFSVWVPRSDHGGDTGRTVWIDQRTGEVVRLEDRSYIGNCVRCLLRISPDAPPLGEPDPEAGDVCKRFPEEDGTPSASALARRVPFVLMEPTYLPHGFALIAANYRQLFMTAPGEDPEAGADADGQCIGLAYLQYSDGLVNIGLGVALPADMDAFERTMANRAVSDDPDACPPVPTEARPFSQDGELIRRRRDRCRTVLRLDGRGEVSILLLGRNEIPEDEYLHIITSVAPVQPDPAGANR